MDAVGKEQLLLHLVFKKPEITNWGGSGDLIRGERYRGFWIDADAFRGDDIEVDVDGLWIAVSLLAERCVALERQLDRVTSQVIADGG